MKAIIDNNLHTILYIDYNGDIPHSVVTFVRYKKYLCIHYWDFFANRGDKSDLRFYNSGFGGDAKNYKCDYRFVRRTGVWVAGLFGKRIKETRNSFRLKRPKVLTSWTGKKTRNPFDAAEETHSYDYCEHCGFQESYGSDYCGNCGKERG